MDAEIKKGIPSTLRSQRSLRSKLLFAENVGAGEFLGSLGL